MEVSKARKEKAELENQIAELIYAFEKKTETIVKGLDIYRTPMYTGFAENLGAVTIQADVRI